MNRVRCDVRAALLLACGVARLCAAQCEGRPDSPEGTSFQSARELTPGVGAAAPLTLRITGDAVTAPRRFYSICLGKGQVLTVRACGALSDANRYNLSLYEPGTTFRSTSLPPLRSIVPGVYTPPASNSPGPICPADPPTTLTEPAPVDPKTAKSKTSPTSQPNATLASFEYPVSSNGEYLLVFTFYAPGVQIALTLTVTDQSGK
jgi:hypothetical protein